MQESVYTIVPHLGPYLLPTTFSSQPYEKQTCTDTLISTILIHTAFGISFETSYSYLCLGKCLGDSALHSSLGPSRNSAYELILGRDLKLTLGNLLTLLSSIAYSDSY